MKTEKECPNPISPGWGRNCGLDFFLPQNHLFARPPIGVDDMQGPLVLPILNVLTDHEPADATPCSIRIAPEQTSNDGACLRRAAWILDRIHVVSSSDENLTGLRGPCDRRRRGGPLAVRCSRVSLNGGVGGCLRLRVGNRHIRRLLHGSIEHARYFPLARLLIGSGNTDKREQNGKGNEQTCHDVFASSKDTTTARKALLVMQRDG